MERQQDCFADLADPRTGNATRYDLLETLTIALCATLCGAEGGVDMALFGKAKEGLLRQFLKLKHGVPSHDTFSRKFRLLDPVAFKVCFQWFLNSFGEVRRAEGDRDRQQDSATVGRLGDGALGLR